MTTKWQSQFRPRSVNTKAWVTCRDVMPRPVKYRCAAHGPVWPGHHSDDLASKQKWVAAQYENPWFILQHHKNTHTG